MLEANLLMGDVVTPSGRIMASQLETSMDFDFMEEFFYNWNQEDPPEISNLSTVGDSLSDKSFDPQKNSLPSESFCWRNNREESDFSPNIFTSEAQIEEFAEDKSASIDQTEKLDDYPIQTFEYGNVVEPGKGKLNTVPSVNRRLNDAVRYIKEFSGDGDILVQIWVPAEKGGRHVLITCGQSFCLDLNCQRLVNYRTISTKYHFSIDANSSDARGLPGRVFLGKVPEWTPDVRLFRSQEYPRVGYAQHIDVRGSIALPIFDPGSRSCLGVVELVMTAERISYSSYLVNVCNALQAVDLGSFDVLNVPPSEVHYDSYQAVLPEIRLVLKASCEIYNLPLAQTWIPCTEQGRTGSRHSVDNYKDCVATVDVACYVNDPSVLDFHKACSEHHLLKGQGVAGKAFTTNQPCFTSDVTAFSKTEYPLAHHARLFNLQAAVAIRLRSVQTGSADFVLEFFLPFECVGVDEQRVILNSLSSTIQQVCWSLRVVTAAEMENPIVTDNTALHLSSRFHNQDIHKANMLNRGELSNVTAQGSKITDAKSYVSVMEDQRNATNSIFPIVQHVSKVGKFSEIKDNNRDLVTDNKFHEMATAGKPKIKTANSTKAQKKVSANSEKSINLEVLRQHFGGSLKDAAKSIGVCPTTLKRICRQHGITRWPSRKIKKVNHSLKKLKIVIESVHGGQGAIPIDGFLCTKCSETPKSESHTQNLCGNSKSSILGHLDQPENSAGTDTSQCNLYVPISISPSCGSQSSSSGESFSSHVRQLVSSTDIAAKSELPVEDPKNNRVKGVLNEVSPSLSITRSSTHPSKLPYRESLSFQQEEGHFRDIIRAKVIYGEEKVRLRLLPSWGIQNLKQEIAQRFNIRSNLMDLKYLDDDFEWVILSCDVDLKECIDLYKSLGIHTIKISAHLVQRTINNTTVRISP